MGRNAIIVGSLAILLTAVSLGLYGATINVPGDHATIQAAINAANPAGGDTVLVTGGPYGENITINKALILQGTGSPVIDAGGLVGGNAITVTADNVTIQGFTIQNASSHDIYANNVNYLTIKENNILSSGVHGVFIVGGSHVDLIKNVLTTHTHYAAVLYWSTSDCTIKNNYVYGNIAGIAIGQYQASDPVPQDFTIVNNTVINNTNPTSGFGIWIAAQNVSIRANDVKNNSVGLYMYDQPFTISSLTESLAELLPNLQAAGIAPVSTGNELKAFSATGNEAFYNDIVGNVRAGLANGAAATWDARFNWWGNATGPSGDGPGTGDVLSYEDQGTNVTFDPWLRVEAALPNSQCGIFRNGIWALDLDDTRSWSGVPPDGVYDFGIAGDVLVVGDWDDDTVDDIGIFRNGTWVLDLDGNRSWSGVPPDGVYDFGIAGDVPVVGDWDGDGQDDIGIFRNGTWALDLDDTRSWSGVPPDGVYDFGIAGDVPVVGDWDGDGQDDIGIFRNGTWVLDLDGNRSWSGVPPDGVYNFGIAGDVPVVGDWDGDGQDDIGIFRNGTWALDLDGNRSWSGVPPDGVYDFGITGDIPVVGNWDGSGGIGTFNLSSFGPKAVTPAGLQVVCSPNPVAATGKVTFQAMGAGIETVQVLVYNLNGELVYESGLVPGCSVTWDLRYAGQATPVANGIYLYSVMAKTGGELIATKVGKLLILR